MKRQGEFRRPPAWLPKGQSELGMLRALLDLLRGVDSVVRLGKRQADFRRGRCLGPGDLVVEWLKPRKPRTIDQETYDPLPESLTVRETRASRAGRLDMHQH